MTTMTRRMEWPRRSGKTVAIVALAAGLPLAAVSVFHAAHGALDLQLGMAVHTHAADMSSEAQVGRPKTSVKILSCEKLANAPGQSITMAIVTFPPNAFTPAHRHPGAVTAFVLKGAVRSQLNGGAIETFGIGGTWFEPPGTIHNFAENASASEPAELLSIFVAEDDCGPLVIPL